MILFGFNIIKRDLKIILYISNNLNKLDCHKFSPPDPENYSAVTEHLIKFALDTGAVAAEMSSLPYQPMTFPVCCCCFILF